MQTEQAPLGWLFNTVVRMHHTCMQSIFRARGLAEISHPQLLFMVEHAQKRGYQLAQNELAQVLGVSASSVAVSLKRMEKSGLITRQAHESDSRRNLIMLTEKGRKLIIACRRAYVELETALFADFSEAECAELRGYFNRLIETMGRMGVAAPGGLERPNFPPSPGSCG